MTTKNILKLLVTLIIAALITWGITFIIISDSRDLKTCEETCFPNIHHQTGGTRFNSYCYCYESKSALRCVDTSRHRECEK